VPYSATISVVVFITRETWTVPGGQQKL